jgi:glycosyltransferase involved in cell wall biosynthesis
MAYAMRDSGHDVTVVAMSWLKDDPENSVAIESGVKVVRVKLPSFFYKRMLIITALKILLFPVFAKYFIRKHVQECDLLVANTPCVTIFGLSGFFKRRFGAKSFLILWDFFPYYLKDLGVVRNKWTFATLRALERMMYNSFDRIGCMTVRNIEFLAENYSYSSLEKVTKLPIWAALKPAPTLNKAQTRNKYGLPKDRVLAVYGGAMSIVQDLSNLLALAEQSTHLEVTFVLIGSGTERENLIEETRARKINNVIFLDSIPRTEYEKLLQACDIGLIFLSHKLSVPSFPSKSLDYFKLSLPVLAGLDSYTDFGPTLTGEARAGFFAQSNQTAELARLLEVLVTDEALRNSLGANGRQFYEVEFNVERAKDTILSTI